MFPDFSYARARFAEEDSQEQQVHYVTKLASIKYRTGAMAHWPPPVPYLCVLQSACRGVHTRISRQNSFSGLHSPSSYGERYVYANV